MKPIKLISLIKSRILHIKVLRCAWTAYRRHQLHCTYNSRRSAYTKRSSDAGLIYRQDNVQGMVQDRLNERGWHSEKRKIGDIHTFVVVPDWGWHADLIPDLKELGEVSWFDYHKLGVNEHDFDHVTHNVLAVRDMINERLYASLVETHQRKAVDWVFVYASGLHIKASTIERIKDKLGLPCVNMCLDDKHCWTGPWMGDHHAGQVGIASAFDLNWTSARVACDWYLAERGCPLYLPEGFCLGTYHPIAIDKDIDISFVGGAYGFRPGIIELLQRNNIKIKTFGSGWPQSEWVQNTNEVFNRSKINLGMGGIGYSEELTNVKGRDFEVPGAGGGLYITRYNSDLASHFDVDKEIICYSSHDELVELVSYYLAHPQEAAEIAHRAYLRSVHEHRWLHRYQIVLQVLGILDSTKEIA